MQAAGKVVFPIALVALGILLFMSVRTCNKNKQNTAELTDMIAAYKDSTHYWRNKAGEEVASRKVVEGSLENMKDFISPDEVKELKRRFDVDIKNLKALIKTTSTGHTTIPVASKPEIVYVDSSAPCPQVTAMMQDFANPYYKLKVRVGEGAYAKLTAYDTTTIVIKRDFTRRFLSKQWYTQVDAINANDSIRSTIQGAFVIREGYRQKFLEIVARAGYRYFKADAVASSFYGGIGAQYNLGRISLTGSYNKMIGGSNSSFVEGGVQISVLRL